jgi:ATP-dependent DNA helicase RecQ
VLAPRKRWPAGTERRGAIVGAEEGRALVYATTPGWDDLLGELDHGDRPLSQELVDGMVRVLSRWRTSWAARPVAVVPVPSRRHDGLIVDLAERIAAVGKLPLVHALEVSGPPPPSDAAPKPRVDHLLATLSVRPDASVPHGPVLVVDDTYRTGWTMTVAATLLRDAGAGAVLPLVVHQLP